jgi:CRP-like cAMP-binding protein
MILHPKEYLCVEGDPGDKLYIVKKGLLLAHKREGAKSFIVGEAGPGTLIGELSLLENQHRPLTYKAVEETELAVVDQKILEQTLQGFPHWFESILHFLAQRLHQAENIKARTDKIRALPSLLFLMCRETEISGKDEFFIEPLIENLRIINGLGYNDAFHLIRALCNLNLMRIVPGEGVRLHIFNPKVIRLLYDTLLTRAVDHTLPGTLLSAGDQLVLSAFIEAAAAHGYNYHDSTAVSATDFLAAYKKLLPGVRFTLAPMESLGEKGFLFTSPAYHSLLEMQNVELFYADMDKVMELLELNRVYPLLDKKLPESF